MLSMMGVPLGMRLYYLRSFLGVLNLSTGASIKRVKRVQKTSFNNGIRYTNPADESLLVRKKYFRAAEKV